MTGCSHAGVQFSRCLQRRSRVGCPRVGTICSVANPMVVATREKGKNTKLMRALEAQGLQCIELPLLKHTQGPDLAILPGVLGSERFDWITVTSPQAAEVFCEAWEQANKPEIQVAAVGKGTSKVLERKGVKVMFVPSKSNAKVLSQELPFQKGMEGAVLYPASARARGELQSGLEARKFQVTRLNTYDTLPVEEVAREKLEEAMKADVITFGSPSAVGAWKLASGSRDDEMAVACIGETSGKAALNAGFKTVFFPEKPGMDGWVDAVLKAVEHSRGK